MDLSFYVLQDAFHQQLYSLDAQVPHPPNMKGGRRRPFLGPFIMETGCPLYIPLTSGIIANGDFDIWLQHLSEGVKSPFTASLRVRYMVPATPACVKPVADDDLFYSKLLNDEMTACQYKLDDIRDAVKNIYYSEDFCTSRTNIRNLERYLHSKMIA